MADRSKKLIEWVVGFTEREPGEVPVFPAIAMRIVDLLESPEVDAETAATMIEQDQAIASKILRTASSALYGGADPTRTVSRAIMRIGFRESMNIAMVAACRSLFDLQDRAELELHAPVWNALWHQSLAGAYGARSVAREVGVGDPEQIFLAALMRHVGSLIVLKAVTRGRVTGRLRLEPTEEELEEAFRRLDARIGVAYLQRCALPPAFVAAAADGRAPELAGGLDPEALAVLRLIDGILDVIRVVPFPTGELGPAARESAERLGLDEPALEYHTLQLAALAEQVRELL